MSDLLIDNIKNDLVITNGDLSLVKGSDAIAQSVQQRLQMFYQEWFLDNTQGVPYFQNILVKQPNFDVVTATIQNCILATPGITELVGYSYQYTNSTRVLTIAFQAKCTNGQIISVSTTVGS